MNTDPFLLGLVGNPYNPCFFSASETSRSERLVADEIDKLVEIINTTVRINVSADQGVEPKLGGSTCGPLNAIAKGSRKNKLSGQSVHRASDCSIYCGLMV